MLASLIELSVNIRGIVLPIHALLGAVGVGGAIVLDVLFFYFLKDRKITLSESKISKGISPVFTYALLGLYITGLFLFLSDIDKYMGSIKFLTKMLVVCVLTINGYLLHYFITPQLHTFSLDNRDSSRRKFTMLAFVCGGISLFSWVTAYILGGLSVLPFPLGVVLITYTVLLVLVVIAALVILRYLRG